GSQVRKGDLLCTVETHEEVLHYAGRFMQYYRENAKYMERTYGFVERLGIEYLRRVLIEDVEGIGQQLDEAMQQGPPYKPPRRLRTRSIGASIVAVLVLVLLIALGSRGFHWFDPALIGYAVATVFAAAAVTYKYTFWLSRPPTGRYWRRSRQIFLSYTHFRRSAMLVPVAISDLFTQTFIRKRGSYRWITHQCIFWGVLLSCLLTFPLTFGWLRF